MMSRICLLLACILVGTTIFGCDRRPKGQVVRSKVTRIDLAYPGAIFKFKQIDGNRAKEIPDDAWLDVSKDNGFDVTILNNKYGDITITKRLTPDAIRQWQKSSEVNPSESIRIEVGSNSFRFDQGHLVEVTLGSRFRVESTTGSCEWPCSRAELERVLGKPRSESKTSTYVGGP